MNSSSVLSWMYCGMSSSSTSQRLGVGGVAAAARDLAVLDAAEFVVLLPEVGLEDFGRRQKPEDRLVTLGEAGLSLCQRQVGEELRAQRGGPGPHEEGAAIGVARARQGPMRIRCSYGAPMLESVLRPSPVPPLPAGSHGPRGWCSPSLPRCRALEVATRQERRGRSDSDDSIRWAITGILRSRDSRPQDSAPYPP